MTDGIWLLGYGLVMAVAAPWPLRRLTSRAHTPPRWGVAAWTATIAGTLAAFVAGIGLFLLDLVGHWRDPDTAFHRCATTLCRIAAGHSGVVPEVGVWLLGVAFVMAVVVLGIDLTRTLVRMHGRTQQHANDIRMVGRRIQGHDVVVLDVDEPAAYCVPGRPDVIVVTTAALSMLDGRQLAAVLDHERAHLTGRHPQLVALLRGLAATFPYLRLMTEGVAHVSRLLEMRADDAAARRHGSQALLAGLLALAHAAPARAGALGAAGRALIARTERLAGARQSGRARAIVLPATALMATLPPITVAYVLAGAEFGSFF